MQFDRVSYHFAWWRFRLTHRTRVAWMWFTQDLCWHFWRRGAWVRGKRCLRCWLKNEMKKELSKEIDRQILYGDGR